MMTPARLEYVRHTERVVRESRKIVIADVIAECLREIERLQENEWKRAAAKLRRQPEEAR